MQVILNNKKRALNEGMSVAELIQKLEYRRAAVWVNEEQLLTSQYDSWILKDGDQIKILRIVAGG